MITIKCSKCKNKIFKYKKIGKGKIIRLYFDRIQKNYAIKRDGKYLCSKCENVIGINKKKFVKMRDIAFTYSGHKIRK